MKSLALHLCRVKSFPLEKLGSVYSPFRTMGLETKPHHQMVPRSSPMTSRQTHFLLQGLLPPLSRGERGLAHPLYCTRRSQGSEKNLRKRAGRASLGLAD